LYTRFAADLYHGCRPRQTLSWQPTAGPGPRRRFGIPLPQGGMGPAAWPDDAATQGSESALDAAALLR